MLTESHNGGDGDWHAELRIDVEEGIVEAGYMLHGTIAEVQMLTATQLIDNTKYDAA